MFLNVTFIGIHLSFYLAFYCALRKVQPHISRHYLYQCSPVILSSILLLRPWLHWNRVIDADLYLTICFPLIILHLSFIRWVQYFISYRNYWGVSDAQQKSSLNPFWTIKSMDAWLSFSYMCTYLSWYENYTSPTPPPQPPPNHPTPPTRHRKKPHESIFCHVWYTFQYFLAAGSILFFLAAGFYYVFLFIFSSLFRIFI